MPDNNQKKVQDKWARWLLETRHGGDTEKHQQMMESLYPVRDKVLEHAGVKEGDVVLDVGAGDGLIAFGALDIVGPPGAGGAAKAVAYHLGLTKQRRELFAESVPGTRL